MFTTTKNVFSVLSTGSQRREDSRDQISVIFKRHLFTYKENMTYTEAWIATKP